MLRTSTNFNRFYFETIFSNECQTKRFLEFIPFILYSEIRSIEQTSLIFSARFRWPCFSPLACRHRRSASLNPDGEKHRPEICPCPQAISPQVPKRKVKKESSLLGCRVGFSWEFYLEGKVGARKALPLSLQSFTTPFSHRLFAPARLEILRAHRLSTYFWLPTFKESREQTEYKNTWNVGFEDDHAV